MNEQEAAEEAVRALVYMICQMNKGQPGDYAIIIRATNLPDGLTWSWDWFWRAPGLLPTNIGASIG